MNFFEFNKKFPTQLDCINHFIGIRYGNDIKCVHCSNRKILHRKDFPKVFQCNDCHNSFSIFKGTIFEKSDTDLRKWMYAIHLFLNGKKGISGYQLQREIGVTYKTAWRMLKQIRMAMGNLENKEFLGLIAEIDETYVGGKPRKKNKKKDDDDTPKNKPGRGTKKEAVVGVVDRENKKVFAQVMTKNKDGKKLTGKQLLDVLNQVIKQDSIIISDEFKGYKPEFGISMARTLVIQKFFAFFMNAKIREMRNILSKELSSAYQSLTVPHVNHRFLDLQSLLIPNSGSK
jgi:transposase-like protein